MFREVCAETGWLAFVVYGSDETVGGEGFQTVVNRGERDGGHAVFDAHEDFHGTGMIGLRHKCLEDGLALFGLSDALFGERSLLKNLWGLSGIRRGGVRG